MPSGPLSGIGMYSGKPLQFLNSTNRPAYMSALTDQETQLAREMGFDINNILGRQNEALKNIRENPFNLADPTSYYGMPVAQSLSNIRDALYRTPDELQRMSNPQTQPQQQPPPVPPQQQTTPALRATTATTTPTPTTTTPTPGTTSTPIQNQYKPQRNPASRLSSYYRVTRGF